MSPAKDARLRAWLESVAQMAIDWLDELDAASEDLEDDELGDDSCVPLSAAPSAVVSDVARDRLEYAIPGWGHLSNRGRP